MIMKFKKSRLFFIIGLIIALVIAAAIAVIIGITKYTLLNIPVFGVQCCFAILSFVIIMLIVCSYANKKAYDQHNDLLKILDNECDPEKFLSLYKDVVSNNSNSFTAMVSRCNYAAGYFGNGEFDEAIKIYNTIDIKPSNPQNQSVIILKEYNLTLIYLFKNELDKAKKHYEELKKIGDEFDKDIPFYENYVGMSKLLTNRIKVFEGDYKGAKEYFKNQQEECPDNFQKVLNKYYLYEIYSKEGKENKVNETLKFIADNGNNLYVAKKAKELLKNKI